jgi:hypothetical protein
MTKIHPLCRSSIDAQFCFVYGRLYNVWRIVPCSPAYGGVYIVREHGGSYVFITWMAAQSPDWTSILFGARTVSMITCIEHLFSFGRTWTAVYILVI